jgi:hypothetical protein
MNLCNKDVKNDMKHLQQINQNLKNLAAQWSDIPAAGKSNISNCFNNLLTYL